MSSATRKKVRVLLLNTKNELLLMYIDTTKFAAHKNSKHQLFWCTIGGCSEPGESVEETALREIYEETGITQGEINLGPVVWCDSVELVAKGELKQFDELYIVARTKQNRVDLHAPTEDEKQVIKKLRWFSFEEIQNSRETIFPPMLSHYLPAIISEQYPQKPIKI